MQARGTTGTTSFYLVLTHYPPSITIPGTSDGPGTTASDERQTLLQYTRASIQQLCLGIPKARHKQTAEQRKYKKEFNKKVQLSIIVRPDDNMYTDCPPRRVRRPDSRSTDLVTECSKNVEDTVTECLCFRTGSMTC